MPDQAVLPPQSSIQPVEPLPAAESSTQEVTQVNLTVKLALGTHLHVTLENQTPDGHRLGSQSLYYGSHETQAAITLEILASPAPAAFLAAPIEAPVTGPVETPVERRPARIAAPPLLTNLQIILRNAGWGFILALVVYLTTRLIALADYPMYFFTDEAVQTLLASDFVRDGFRNYAKEFLPTFFYNVYQYNLSVSVYLQIIPHLLFGNSVVVTRGVSVLFSMLPAVSGGLAFKQFFNSRYPWLAVLMLSIMPAWFLHSRTAFETSLAVSFYAMFLYFYLRYRQDHPRALYPAVIFAALAFYTYSPAQLVLVVTAALLFLSDLRYHLRLPRNVFHKTAGLTALLVIPYLRFYLEHPNENLNHLQQIGSYWLAQIPLIEKLGHYFGEYLAGLNPLYWFFPNSTDIPRHIMGNYGHLLVFSLPFIAWGLIIAIKNFRSSAYRTLLIAVIAAPSGAALVGLGITRTLFMVIPAALLGALGLASVMEWLLRTWQGKRRGVVAGTFLLLAGFNLFLLSDALTYGRNWSVNYGLSGMQYGAEQVFSEIINYHQQSPETKFILSPSWANGTDILERFFLPHPIPLQLASIDTYLTQETPFDSSTLFILPPEEYQRVLDSAKFTDIKVEETLPWPNGQPGFYFLRMHYVDNIKNILNNEAAARQVMLQESVTVDNEGLQVHYSRLDMGAISNLFDNDLNTLIRTESANPLKLQIDFPAPHRLNGLILRIGSTAATLDVAVQAAGENIARTYHQELKEDVQPRPLTVDFGEALYVTSLFIKLKNTNDSEPGHVHLWEIIWK